MNVSVPQKSRSGVYSTPVLLVRVRVPFEVVETIVEIERVSPISGSVSFWVRLRSLLRESSPTVSESFTAVGAVLEQLTVIVPVAVFETAPDASVMS